jgi:hypothetical protein
MNNCLCIFLAKMPFPSRDIMKSLSFSKLKNISYVNRITTVLQLMDLRTAAQQLQHTAVYQAIYFCSQGYSGLHLISVIMWH